MTSRRPFRATSIVIATMLAVGALAGCGPTDPTPTPTPTGFASEAEAFAAAEATYRAYVDALNQVDLSDPSTFEEVYRWTTGDANAEARESFSQMHADGWMVAGQTGYDSLRLVGFASTPIRVEVCLDVTDVDVLDEGGQSVVPSTRLDRQAVSVDLTHADTATGLAISASNAIESELCD
ncbi:hypothetical protein [Microbacterium schleiferi]|jgi:hypothetical protein|uniref:hypothetical protein n=1 Tax=Microbacterium schleiferi TaxID=69362 RepID=UPI0035C7DA0B